MRPPARPLTRRERQRLSELILSGQPIPSIYKPLLFPSPLDPIAPHLEQPTEQIDADLSISPPAQLTLIERASRFKESVQEDLSSPLLGDFESTVARSASASGWRDRLILGDNLPSSRPS